MNKHLLSFVLSFTLCLGLTAPALAALPSNTQTFSDVPVTYWAYEQIEAAYAAGVISGTLYNEQTGERQFSPEASLTVAQMVVIFTRAFYADEVAANTVTDTWYARNQEVADLHNLMQNISTTDMNASATRFDMAHIMWNIMCDLGLKKPTPDVLKKISDEIPDWNTIDSNSYDAVTICYYYNLLSGTDSKGTFDGASPLSRSQCATVYLRLKECLDNMATEELPQVSDPTFDPITTPAESTIPSTPIVNDFSAEYMSSKYYRALINVELTGDYRTDIIAIAESQIGYCEGDSADQLDGSYPGSGNYSEYGRFLGSNGRAWCSEFASWCARQAGVPTSILASSRGANIKTFAAPYYTWGETVYAGGSYTPQPGDLVLFAWTGTSTTANNLSHTAIVSGVVQQGDTVEISVIHGNSGDCVKRSCYYADANSGSVSRGQIVYFIAPDY